MNDSIQEEKAILCRVLSETTMRVPAGVANGGIMAVRQWKIDRKKSQSVLADKRSSVNDLQQRIDVMEKYR